MNKIDLYLFVSSAKSTGLCEFQEGEETVKYENYDF